MMFGTFCCFANIQVGTSLLAKAVKMGPCYPDVSLNFGNVLGILAIGAKLLVLIN
jgi:hypothetical protein